MLTCASDGLLSIIPVAASDYGLFLSDEDPRKGIWLESGRTLDYYMLRNGVHYRPLFLLHSLHLLIISFFCFC